jgi:hypothetical protein
MTDSAHETLPGWPIGRATRVRVFLTSEKEVRQACDGSPTRRWTASRAGAPSGARKLEANRRPPLLYTVAAPFQPDRPAEPNAVDCLCEGTKTGGNDGAPRAPSVSKAGAAPARLPHESPRGARGAALPGGRGRHDVRAAELRAARAARTTWPSDSSCRVAASPPRGLLLAPRYDVAPTPDPRPRGAVETLASRPSSARRRGRLGPVRLTPSRRRRREDAPLARHRRDPRRRSSASSSAPTTKLESWS